MLLEVAVSVRVRKQAQQQITGHTGHHVVIGLAMLLLWCIEVLIVILVVELESGWWTDIGGLLIGLW